MVVTVQRELLVLAVQLVPLAVTAAMALRGPLDLREQQEPLVRLGLLDPQEVTVATAAMALRELLDLREQQEPLVRLGLLDPQEVTVATAAMALREPLDLREQQEPLVRLGLLDPQEVTEQRQRWRCGSRWTFGSNGRSRWCDWAYWTRRK